MTNHDSVLRAIVHVGIAQLNEMQQAVLNVEPDRNLLLLSPTGSGKTLAFLLPLLTTLSGVDRTTEVLIIAPSRELAMQIEGVFRSMGSGFRVVCCYGGHPVRTERKSLEHPPAVLIGTPGRLLDHIKRGSVQLENIHTLILDEFDKSLELGFQDEMEEILEHLPVLQRRVLTSATEGIEIPRFANLTRPIRLNFLEQVRTNKALVVHTVKSPENDKIDTLYRLLGELKGESVLVFCNYRESVERVSESLATLGVDNECFHGGMEQLDRERSLSMFRNGSTSVFISTDLAARGLDIPEVKHVIHYHLPINEEAYTHRNGRTARMHADGNAYLIINPVESTPDYLQHEPDEFFLPAHAKRPIESPWVTLTINKGKRDKLSKKDIVGFLYQKGGLDKDDLGMVEVKESCAFAAVKRTKRKALLQQISGQKIKGLKAKFY